MIFSRTKSPIVFSSDVPGGVPRMRDRPALSGGLAPWALAVVLLASWAVADFARHAVDYPLIRWLNGGARVQPLLDRAVVWVTADYLLSGVVFVTLIWYCWFASADPLRRSFLLSGTIAAFLSGMISRVLQLALPIHVRPMFDANLGMVLPVSMDSVALSHWSSFPSDHAAVQFGLAAVIYLARPRLGVLAFAWALLLNVARIYLGIHFPTDVVGGAALGMMLVVLARRPWGQRGGAWLLGWERTAQGAFYAIAFLISYQIATLFDDARTVASATLAILRHALTGAGVG